MVQGTYQPSSAATVYLSQFTTNGVVPSSSMNGRSRKQMNPKKVGVRRYRRYLNKLWLLQGAEDVDLVEEDFVPFEPRHSGFSKLFTDSTAWNLMLPFADCTEDEEKILYMTLVDHRKGQKATSNNNNNAPLQKTPKEKFAKFDPSAMCTETYESEEFNIALRRSDKRFNQLDKKVRKLLQSDPKSKLLESIESQIVDYLETEQNAWLPLNLNADDGLERVLTHGICHFYSFQSKSELVSDKLVVSFKKSSHSVEVPMKLSTYLSFASLL